MGIERHHRGRFLGQKRCANFEALATQAEPIASLPDGDWQSQRGQDNPNEARTRFLVEGAVPSDLGGYDRAVFLFDGHDAAQVEAVRVHWKTMKDAGHAVTCWR